MAFGKSGVNLVFALVVSVLALTAAISIYVNSGRQVIQPSATKGSPNNALPENHPDIDISQKLAALNQMSAKDPKNPEYQIQIANLYYDLGQYEKAADYYQRGLRLRPGDPNAETDLAVCMHYLGQDDKALKTLDKVLKYSPGFAEAMFNKGIILISGKKDIKAGISVWEDLLRTNPDFPRRSELEERINNLKRSIR
jgi:tetratricopeptide (TPR) repeat protein